MSLWKVFTTGSLLFKQEWHGRQSESIDPYLQPKISDLDQFKLNLRIVKIQFRLVPVEPMPVVSLGFLVPRPV